MIRSLHAAAFAVVACLLWVTACTSAVPGTGVGSAPPPVPHAPGCAGVYCDHFATASDWYHGMSGDLGGFSPAFGGSYRLGEQSDRVFVAYAPYVLDFSATTSAVHLSADVVVGRRAARFGTYGLSCWDKRVGDELSGFLFEVGRGGADITLLDAYTGHRHTLSETDGAVRLRPWPTPNHLVAGCTQHNHDGDLSAELHLSVNGRELLHMTYARTSTNYPWTRSYRVGLLVGGRGAVGYFDNVLITVP